MTRHHAKHIACLECFWTHDFQRIMSIGPVLELLETVTVAKTIKLTSNTPEELRFNLSVVQELNGFRVLYLAFHGGPGRLYLPGDVTIEIEDLAEMMGRRFRNWIVYFDSCSTMRVDKKRVRDFMDETGVKMVMGYREDVYWLESIATALLAFAWLQKYADMGAFWVKFRKAYKDMISMTGLEAIYRK